MPINLLKAFFSTTAIKVPLKKIADDERPY